MKRIITTIIFSGALLFFGCNKWLDVKPEAQTTQKDLFQTERGFKDALTGAYIGMKSGNLYCGSLMWGNIEYMAKNWDVKSSVNTGLTNLVNANYNDAIVRGWMDNTYADLYKVIADVNGILENIDERKSVFSTGNYELIKGEALAIRAFCHFDVLRMFGPMPGNPGDTQILPYVKTVSHDIHESLTYRDFTQMLLADLDEAEVLLKGADPILKYTMQELNPVLTDQTTQPVVQDNDLLYRQVRMNYYAALALKARVYMWLAPLDDANRVKAARYAGMVTDALDHNGARVFRLGESSDQAAGDYTMSPEHIMALSVYNLAATANNLFGNSGNLVRYDLSIQDGFYYLNSLFPPSERTSDIRWQGMWTYQTNSSGNTNYVMYKKFIQRDNRPVLQVPLIRLSEMYLILTECAASKSEAEIPYRFYCEKKGIPFTSGFNSSDWISDRRNKIIREYVREFYGEGQTFFTYKRFNVTTLPASWTYNYFTGAPSRYIVPKPDREINYHNN